MKCYSRNNYSQSRPRRDEDEIKDIILELLDQSKGQNPNVLDKNQPFVREFLLRHGHQSTVVAYLDQTLRDVDRFCTNDPHSPFVVDTTFNIADYYLTQTCYLNLSLVSKTSGKHPWFPGPLLVHRGKNQDEFKFFWQAVKRGCPALESLQVLGTDEETAVYDGILSETKHTIHLLGVEHVMANVEKKLEELHFPPTQKRQIIDDIFGGPRTVSSGSLCESKSNEEFDNKVSEMKERWEEIEKKYTRNAPPKFVKYFSQHKEEKIRNSMTQYVRKRAGVDGVYGQNPIEWQHFLSKSEINDVVKDSGQTYRSVSLPVALDALKGRTLRLYTDSVKALYGEGPFRVSAGYNQFVKSYEEWKDLNKDQRMEHTKKFFTAKPRRPAVTKKSQPLVAVNETTSSQDPRSTGVEEDVTGLPLPKHLSIKFHECSIPEECIPTATLRAIFQKAELLINEKGAIKEAAIENSEK